jgi:hypothetical protein
VVPSYRDLFPSRCGFISTAVTPPIGKSYPL